MSSQPLHKQRPTYDETFLGNRPSIFTTVCGIGTHSPFPSNAHACRQHHLSMAHFSLGETQAKQDAEQVTKLGSLEEIETRRLSSNKNRGSALTKTEGRLQRNTEGQLQQIRSFETPRPRDKCSDLSVFGAPSGMPSVSGFWNGHDLFALNYHNATANETQRTRGLLYATVVSKCV